MTPKQNKTPGRLDKEEDKKEAIAFIASIFDRPNRGFSWRDCLPGDFDDVWSWTHDGERVSGLVARPVKTVGGGQGIGLGMICTAPEHRNRGHAKALVQSVMDHYRSQKAAFAILWAKNDLAPFYRTLGFEAVFEEICYKVAPGGNADVDLDGVNFVDFMSLDHTGFDQARRDFDRRNAACAGEGSVVRDFQNGKWRGLSASRGRQYGILFGGTAENPDFHGIIGHGGNANLIIEFIGAPEDFRKAVSWIIENLGEKPIEYNITAPHLQMHLQGVEVCESAPAYTTLFNSFGASSQKIPVTNWLDRV